MPSVHPYAVSLHHTSFTSLLSCKTALCHVDGTHSHDSKLCRRLHLVCSALRELALTFYDTRAIVVEVVARLVGMGSPIGTPLYARQLAALEALQIYAPLGHGLGLRPLCAQLEDKCFQVRQAKHTDNAYHTSLQHRITDHIVIFHVQTLSGALGASYLWLLHSCPACLCCPNLDMTSNEI